MGLTTSEGLEVGSRLLQRLADALKDDNKISRTEAMEIIVKTITDLGGEIIDNE